MSLTGKVILITGASAGIGKAVAQRVAKSGASVVINYLRDTTSANSLVDEIGSDQAFAVQADVSKTDDIHRLIEATVAKFEHIDVVIPNAGVLPMKDLDSTTEADFDAAFALNVKGPYFLAQEAARHMPSGGRIIFVSTAVTSFSGAAPPYILYAATKGAIEQMTRLAAKDLGRKGIMVNAVAPGPTQTELFLKGKSEETLRLVASANPFKRVAVPEEITGAFHFLCGPDSSWISGEVIRVDGAMALH